MVGKDPYPIISVGEKPVLAGILNHSEKLAEFAHGEEEYSSGIKSIEYLFEVGLQTAAFLFASRVML
jgi:hypothetical protein